MRPKPVSKRGKTQRLGVRRRGAASDRSAAPRSETGGRFTDLSPRATRATTNPVFDSRPLVKWTLNGSVPWSCPSPTVPAARQPAVEQIERHRSSPLDRIAESRQTSSAMSSSIMLPLQRGQPKTQAAVHIEERTSDPVGVQQKCDRLCHLTGLTHPT
jgi:hypothetical protein